VASHCRRATNFKTNRRIGAGASAAGAARESKEGRMLQSSENPLSLKSAMPASNPNAFNPVKTVTAPVDQATIGRTLVIKGEITGSEALYIDGRVEGKIIMPESRVTVGRNGTVAANITANEVVIMGKVQGNVDCLDRVEIRNEGILAGDVVTLRISVEEGAILKGGVEVRDPQKMNQKAQSQGHQNHDQQKQDQHSQNQHGLTKPAASTAGA